MSPERIDRKSLFLAQSLGMIQQSFPEKYGTFIQENGIENNINYFDQICSIEKRDTSCILIFEFPYFFNQLPDELEKNIPNEPEISAIAGNNGLTFLINDSVSSKEIDQINDIFSKNNLNIKRTIIQKWAKIITVWDTLLKNNVPAEGIKIIGIDEIFENKLKELKSAAKRKNSKYESMNPSPYDPHIGQHYVDQKGYRNDLKRNISTFEKDNRKIIRRFRMKKFINQYLEEAMNFKFGISYENDPNATPGINHITGLPYY